MIGVTNRCDVPGCPLERSSRPIRTHGPDEECLHFPAGGRRGHLCCGTRPLHQAEASLDENLGVRDAARRGPLAATKWLVSVGVTLVNYHKDSNT
jgi:hypothetical protein